MFPSHSTPPGDASPEGRSAARGAARGAHERYELRGLLAEGAMGAVYSARDRMTGEELAIKRPALRDRTHSSQVLEAFAEEYDFLVSLHHPRVVRAFDYGIDATGPYYTMELVGGSDLRQRAQRPWQDVCAIVRDIASALSLVHARRMVHRDLSPANVRVDPSGHCKLLDFGAVTPFGVTPCVVGTPPLIAPEALHDRLLDQRTDLYALGALAYWLLTGRHAYRATRIEHLESAWRVEAPRPGALVPMPTAFDGLVRALLQRDPALRPASAAEVLTALDGLQVLPDEYPAVQCVAAQSFLRHPPLVGRERQLGEARRVAAQARRGEATLLHLCGSAGAGVGRFTRELRRRAARAAWTPLTVDARNLAPGAAALPRAIAALAQAELSPDEFVRDPSSGLPPAIERTFRSGIMPAPALDTACVESMAAIVHICASQPLAVFITHAEALDAHAFRALGQLLEAAATAPLWIVCAEHAEPGAGPQHRHERATQLSLEPLHADETRQLVALLFGPSERSHAFADGLHQACAGRPGDAVLRCRALLAGGAIQHRHGAWLLPVDASQPAREGSWPRRTEGARGPTRALSPAGRSALLARATSSLAVSALARDDRAALRGLVRSFNPPSAPTADTELHDTAELVCVMRDLALGQAAPAYPRLKALRHRLARCRMESAEWAALRAEQLGLVTFLGGCLAAFEHDPRGALGAATALEALGDGTSLTRAAGRLRQLYQLRRGDLGAAQLHAARTWSNEGCTLLLAPLVGWSAAALVPAMVLATDTNASDMPLWQALSGALPGESPQMYAALTRLLRPAGALIGGACPPSDPALVEALSSRLAQPLPGALFLAPALLGALAGQHRRAGEHAEAQRIARAGSAAGLPEFPVLGLEPALQDALAGAALGKPLGALSALSALERSLAASAPLALGRLAEARADVLDLLGRSAAAARARQTAAHHFRATRCWWLIARSEWHTALAYAHRLDEPDPSAPVTTANLGPAQPRPAQPRPAPP